MASKTPWRFKSSRPEFRFPSPRMRLVVFCSSESLPALLDIANPDRHNGAVAAIPLPMDRPKPTPRDLEEPLTTGRYAFSCASGTLISGHVTRREDDGTEGHAPSGACGFDEDSDAITMLKEAPFTVCLALKRPSVLVTDSVLFGVNLADRIGYLANGLVYDVDGCRRYAPGQWQVDAPIGEVDVREHVTLHVERGEHDALWLHTHGLIKFGRPEIEMVGVPREIKLEASALLLNVSQCVLDGTIMKPGDVIGMEQCPLTVITGRTPRSHLVTPVIELAANPEKPFNTPEEISAPILTWFQTKFGQADGLSGDAD